MYFRYLQVIFWCTSKLISTGYETLQLLTFYDIVCRRRLMITETVLSLTSRFNWNSSLTTTDFLTASSNDQFKFNRIEWWKFGRHVECQTLVYYRRVQQGHMTALHNSNSETIPSSHTENSINILNYSMVESNYPAALIRKILW